MQCALVRVGMVVGESRLLAVPPSLSVEESQLAGEQPRIAGGASRMDGCPRRASPAARTSARVRQFSVWRGRALSFFATALGCCCVTCRRSIPFGKYWRKRPFVFSRQSARAARGKPAFRRNPVPQLSSRTMLVRTDSHERCVIYFGPRTEPDPEDPSWRPADEFRAAGPGAAAAVLIVDRELKAARRSRSDDCVSSMA